MSETNGFASPEDLLTPRPRSCHVVEHANYGKWKLRSINSLQRAKIEALAQGKSIVTLKENLIVAMLVDPESEKPLLIKEQVPQLQKQDAGYIDWLASECLKLAGFSDNDVEELAKN